VNSKQQEASAATQSVPVGRRFWRHRHASIAVLCLVAIAIHLVQRFTLGQTGPTANYALWFVLALGGIPLVLELAARLVRGQFGSDLLAGISIVTAVVLGEYLAGTLVVLMLSGGEALESYAVRSASSVLNALVKRMPSVAHRKLDGQLVDVPVGDIAIDDMVLVMPHETCPVDGVVIEGHGSMDEAYLTGEPYQMSKSVGSDVLSGAINGDSALTIRATRLAVDSRYAKIMRVMEQSEQQRPRLRRLGDQLGAWYTPLAVGIALLAWWASGQAVRFLAVLVVATPCPLLIAIPVAIIGSISLAARRGVIIRDPAILEQIGACRTMIFDKTGTLTYGEPQLTEQLPAAGIDGDEMLRLAASLERYSKHPLAAPMLKAAQEAGLELREAEEVQERPGQGLRGVVAGRRVQVTSRKQMAGLADAQLPPVAEGLECVVLVDGRYAATYRFRDAPRAEGVSFVSHLTPRHHFDKLMLVSGDRESEVRYLAGQMGIHEIHAETSPEEKLEIVRRETARARTLYVGDGINDAPALMAATVGVAMGQKSEVTSEASGAVVLDNSLRKVDELLHIGQRMRSIALQSAVGGMALSLIGMLVAAAGYLPPVAGALLQEVIDVIAVLNALRAAAPPRKLTDF
jgi:heavy metal translocating P-type ATPase